MFLLIWDQSLVVGETDGNQISYKVSVKCICDEGTLLGPTGFYDFIRAFISEEWWLAWEKHPHNAESNTRETDGCVGVKHKKRIVGEVFTEEVNAELKYKVWEWRHLSE